MAIKGRPRSGEKRQQILTTAIELFMEQGFEGTSMDIIANRANVSKQTVYSHFGSKEDLFAEAIGRKCIAHDLTNEMIDDEQPCADMLFELGKRFLGMLMSEGPIQVYRLCVGSAHQHPELSKLFFNSGPNRVISLLTNYLARQTEKGRLRIDNPRYAANQFLFMVRAEEHMRAVLNVGPVGEPGDRDAYVKSCVNVFMRAYGQQQ